MHGNQAHHRSHDKNHYVPDEPVPFLSQYHGGKKHHSKVRAPRCLVPP